MTLKQMQKAIFLDRDGTINEEMGYINHPDRFKIFPFIAESIILFNQSGFVVIIITNQSGIARGYYSETLVEDLHNRLIVEMQNKGARIDAIYYCPHHPTEGREEYRKNCDCRKPKPGLILRAVQEHNISLPASYAIGDRYQDIVMARQLDIKTGLVLTGYGLGEYTYDRQQWKIQPDYLGQDLLDIAKQITAQQAHGSG
jgi:D-glycero-D-manno-heptose 1,7-bisphosphate phosphatase